MKKKVIGKSFADRVRDVVRAIPRGQTMSYGDVAQKAGYPNAARAVGTIMRDNYDNTVPCHRVIRADGTIGQYNRGGVAKKRALLIKEGAFVAVLFLMLVSSSAVTHAQEPIVPHIPSPRSLNLPALAIPQQWLTGFLAPVEAWRIKQADHFIRLRSRYQVVVIGTSIKEVGDLLVPESPGAPGVEVAQQATTRSGSSYARLIATSALASFFAQQFFFYVAVVLVVFIVLRLILRMLV